MLNANKLNLKLAERHYLNVHGHEESFLTGETERAWFRQVKHCLSGGEIVF